MPVVVLNNELKQTSTNKPSNINYSRVNMQ